MRQCPQYTLNNVLLNFIEHVKKWGGQLDIRPPQSKNWGGRVPPIPPGLAPLRGMELNHKKCKQMVISFLKYKGSDENQIFVAGNPVEIVSYSVYGYLMICHGIPMLIWI